MNPVGVQAATDIRNAGVFQLDGTIMGTAATRPPFDWADLFNAGGQPINVGPPLVGSAFMADYAEPDQTFHQESNSDLEDLSQWGCKTQNNPQDKTNILNAYAAVFRPTTGPAVGHTLLYLGMERGSPNGDADLGFWLLHNPTDCVGGSFTGSHTPGDLLVLATFTNGGTVVTVQLLRWNAPGSLTTLVSGADCPTASATAFVCGIANSTNISAPWPNQHNGGSVTLPPPTFTELGIDLTAASPGGDQCFVSLKAETRASQSIDATLKDYALTSLSVCRSPAIITQPSATDVTIGDSVTDQARLAGATADAGGTVTYTVFSGTTCSGPVVFTVTVPVTNGAVPSATFTPAAPGPYQWLATYSGDLAGGGLNRPATSSCGTEPLTVHKVTPVAETSPSTSEAVAGSPIADAATVNLGDGPTGTVTFELFGPGGTTCTGVPVDSVTQTLVSGTASTGPITAPTAAGSYRWLATYSGDANNNAVSSQCGAETLTVVTVLPELITTPRPQEVVVGDPIRDTATINSSVTPIGGAVTFTLYGPGDAGCTNAIATFGPVKVVPATPPTSATATSDMFTTTQVGTYRWTASYSGDTAHAPANTACADEPVTVLARTPGITTSPTPEETPVGGQISDVATLTGAFNPTGSVTFAVFGPTDQTCAGPARATLTAQVSSAGVARSPLFTTSVAGTLHWRASYPGDPNNNPVTSVCADEPVLVDPAAPTISTATSAGGLLGVSVSETATVSGGLNPTGAVTFQAFGPDNTDCVNPAVFTDTVPLTGGMARTSFTPLVTGTYEWIATYNGDAANSTVATACREEPFVIHIHIPHIDSATVASVSMGGSFSDAATLSGGFNPTGTVLFELFGPDDPICSGVDQVASFPGVALSGLTARSPSFTPMQAGTYHWLVTYSGDAANASVITDCQDEPVTVTGPGPGPGLPNTGHPASR